MRAFALIALAGLVCAPALAAQDHGHATQGHDHAAHAAAGHQSPAAPAVGPAGAQASPLTEPGNGAFAAIQEVVRLLESRPDTDWSKVDLEALRKHLVDMENMTLRAEVVSQEAIPGGARIAVRGVDAEAHASIGRALRAHAGMIAAERGWTMRVETGDVVHRFTVTSPRPEDAPKIRGLGYIGILALGDHHTPHHLMMATGGEPHAH